MESSVVTQQGNGGTTPAELNPEALAALAAALGGSITVNIVTADTTYALNVTIPTGPGTSYGFKLTSTPKAAGGQATTLANFQYKDASDFLVNVAMPTITSTDGKTSITAAFNLQEGTV